jgi:hypothetical protein
VLPDDLIGKTVKHVMVHDPKPMYLDGDTVLQSFGAVDIWTEDCAVVLRSTLRYSQPRLSTVSEGQLSTDATVTVCSHEEADWLSGRLGPSWEPKRMGHQTIAAFNPAEPEVCLRSTDGRYTWIAYRADLDGSWFISPAQEPFAVDAIRMAGCDEAFGWLLPEAPYPLHWDGQLWQTLAMAWACVDKPAFSSDRDRTYRQIYSMRLLQNGNLLRRFAALRYPIHSTRRPWLAEQIEALRSRSELAATRYGSG